MLGGVLDVSGGRESGREGGKNLWNVRFVVCRKAVGDSDQ